MEQIQQDIRNAGTLQRAGTMRLLNSLAGPLLVGLSFLFCFVLLC